MVNLIVQLKILNLQKKFNILTETYQSYGLAPIGQSFLRKYAQLLSN